MKDNLTLVFDVAVNSALRQLGAVQGDQREIDHLISRQLEMLGVTNTNSTEIEVLLGREIGTHDRVEYFLSEIFPHLRSLIALGKVQACLVAIRRNEIPLVLDTSKEKIDSAFNDLGLSVTLKNNWLKLVQNAAERTASWQYMIDILGDKMREDKKPSEGSTIHIGTILAGQVQVGNENEQIANINIQELVEKVARSPDPEAKSLLKKLLENATVGSIIGAGVSSLLALL